MVPKMPKNTVAPLKSSFVSAPTPGPRPLPAPPLVTAPPEILVDHPDATFPNLQDYILQLRANAGSEDSGSGGWSTPGSPSSLKTEGMSSICGKTGDAMKS